MCGWKRNKRALYGSAAVYGHPLYSHEDFPLCLLDGKKRLDLIPCGRHRAAGLQHALHLRICAAHPPFLAPADLDFDPNPAQTWWGWGLARKGENESQSRGMFACQDSALFADRVHQWHCCVLACKSVAADLLSLCSPPVQDMEQLYEMWLKSQKPEKGEDPAAQANKENGKQIHMPTDYAEVMVSHRAPAVLRVLVSGLLPWQLGRWQADLGPPAWRDWPASLYLFSLPTESAPSCLQKWALATVILHNLPQLVL